MQLEPCPCCGSSDIIPPDHEEAPVYCKTCWLRAVNLSAWNRRTPPTSQSEALVEELARAMIAARSAEPSDQDQWHLWSDDARAILPILKREVAKAKADAEILAEGLAHIAEYGRANPGYGYSCGTKAASVLAFYREKN